MRLSDRFDSGVIEVPEVSVPENASSVTSMFLDDLHKFAATRMPMSERFREGMTKAADVIRVLETENRGQRRKIASLESYFEFEKLAWELVDQGIFPAEEVREKVAAWAASSQTPAAVRDQYAYGLHDMPEMGKVAEPSDGEPISGLDNARHALGDFLQSCMG